MTVRKIALAAALTMVAAPGLGHDVWLQPRQFSIAAPAAVPIEMFVGHGTSRDRWGVSEDRVVLFRTIGPDGVIDRKRSLTMGNPRGDATVRFERAGGYLVLLQSSSAFSGLPARRFNDYVAEEGITPIAADRRRRALQDTEGRENYSRRAKAIVQVGPVDRASIERVIRPAGQSLEIVPGRHPMALGKDRRLPVRVLYRGRPLSGTLVKITNLAADSTPVATRRTGADGRAVFPMPWAGQWQMNVVWASPLENDPRANYDTTFASLTFATIR